MQHLSTTFLSLSLAIMVTAISLALLLAAWLMAQYLLDGLTLGSFPSAN
ncbi:hypothetical protein [Spirosoma sp. KNUC1025]|nr:hypothetical protein [Spirosoma sp. KNUC1025]UFH57707.1 hypothetical protein LN737_32280 [Spirosoma sp. KNUC1025]